MEPNETVSETNLPDTDITATDIPEEEVNLQEFVEGDHFESQQGCEINRAGKVLYQHIADIVPDPKDEYVAPKPVDVIVGTSVIRNPG